jgi:hypothetical protein
MVEVRVPENEAGKDRFPSFREYRLTERGHKLVTRTRRPTCIAGSLPWSIQYLDFRVMRNSCR